MRLIFIFRELTLSDFYVSFSRIDNEIIFSEYKAAKNFAASKFSKNSSQDSLTHYRYEIVSMGVDCLDGYYEKEIFSIDGVLLTKESFSGEGLIVSHRLIPQVISASAGQLIRIFGNLECGKSPFVKEGLGVVLSCLIGDDTTNLTIGYFESNGDFSHMHDSGWLIKSIVPLRQGGAVGAKLKKIYKSGFLE